MDLHTSERRVDEHRDTGRPTTEDRTLLQALRNKSFGHALEFVWSHDGNYATREASGKIAIFQDFKEAVSFKPAFQPEELFGGRLLGVKGSTGSVQGGEATSHP